MVVGRVVEVVGEILDRREFLVEVGRKFGCGYLRIRAGPGTEVKRPSADTWRVNSWTLFVHGYVGALVVAGA
jgi:hypothetical protein